MSRIKLFTSQNTELLQKAFEIRRQVFIEEQNVNEDEEFEFEDQSIHYLIYHRRKALGTARHRETNKGIKLERFALLKEARGKGLGYDLLRYVITNAKQYQKTIYLNSQVAVVGFYKAQGFVINGPKFIEAGIKHYPMEYVNAINMEKALEKAICRR